MIVDSGATMSKRSSTEYPDYRLNPKVVASLVAALRIRSSDKLTPEYLSNISAAQLLNAGVTPVAVAQAQEWLMRNELSLKRAPPDNAQQVKAIAQAIALLDAFHFDTVAPKAQLEWLSGGES